MNDRDHDIRNINAEVSTFLCTSLESLNGFNACEFFEIYYFLM